MTRFLLVRSGAVLALVGAVAVLLPGCGRSVGSVSGKVTYQGKPLKAGNVTFVSTDKGESAAAGINEDGTYTVAKLRSGSYKVCVDNSSFRPAGGGVGTAIVPKGAKTGPPPGANIPEGYSPSDPNAMLANKGKYVPIPAKYAKEDTTDLSFEFKGGTQTFDIDLK